MFDDASDGVELMEDTRERDDAGNVLLLEEEESER